MEHLPPIKNPFEPIQVPYLGGPLYDGHDFSGYPTRQNWNSSLLLQGDLQGRTSLAASQFLQNWIYFGMLNEALKLEETDNVDLTPFIRTDPETQEEFITTGSLHAAMTQWFDRLKTYPDEEAPSDRKKHVMSKTKHVPAYYARFRATMKAACGVWRDLLQPPTPELAALTLLSQEILLSINILGAALDVGVTEVTGSSADYDWRINPRNDWLMKRMIRQGWCPCSVEQLSHPCMTFLYYSSLLGPPRRGEDHSKCAGDEGAVCLQANVRTETYVPKHVSECDGCASVPVDTGEKSEVAYAIQKGYIPIVKVVVEEDGEVSVEVGHHSVENPAPYIAISHVWADGLGDPLGNTLPRCQMKRMAAMLSDLPLYTESMETNDTDISDFSANQAQRKPQHFWMDTLCIPVNNQSLRHQAIVKMREVYRSASSVLVLDSELMKHSADAPYTETFTRITTSTWLRRLWTLQEATINANLLFQCADRAIYVGQKSKLYLQQWRDTLARPWDMVAWECNRYNFNFLATLPYFSPITRINMVWNSLEHRTTSRGGDEPLCIAILLDLDVEELQKEPGACTVKKFWSLHRDGIPATVIFIPGPKLSDEGYRWAPSNLKSLRVMGRDLNAKGDVTPEGLRVTFGGVKFDKLKHPVRSILVFELQGVKFFVREILRGGGPSWEGLNLFERQGLAMVVADIDGLKTPTVEVTVGLGILVDGFSDEVTRDGFAKVRYLRLVAFVMEGSFNDLHPNIPWSKVQTEEKLLEPVMATDLGLEQKWCVG